ncbi:MAG: hypothetical protein LBG42_09385 [Treponema sp.]|jgi:hypothetical protein|nr:hypothetical protein [Treponema sp.]
MGLLSKAGIKAVPRSAAPELGLLRQGQKKKAAHIISPQGVTDGIGAYHRNNPVFQGIVLEMPDEYDNSTDFSAMISKIINGLGASLPLPYRFCLVLIPGVFDHELLTHRLTRSLKIRAPFYFRANSPGEALKLLHAYL